MISIRAHLNNIALHHTIFDLPFAFMGALLAANGSPRIWDLLWIAVAITSGRAAALAIDNWADLKYDSQQPRMAYRAMVQGRISKREALVFILLCFVLLVFSVAQLRPICLQLLPIAAIPFVIYPFTKRFTGWCHLFLGLAIGMAPAGGWVAAGGRIDPPMLLLCTAVALWIGAFDAMYGAQDEEFDKSQGLHSLATEFGAKRAFWIAGALHIVCIVCFFLVGILLHLGSLYFFGVGIAGGVLIYQHRILKYDDFSRLTQGYFMRNGIVSMAICLCAWLNYMV